MKFYKNHKWAILLALVSAVIIAYPQIYLRYDLGAAYQGIEAMGVSDDEANWLMRIREVQDGHPSLSSTYTKDGKDGPYLFQPLGSMVVGFLGQIFSLDLNNTLLLFRFLFPIIVFLLIYAFLLLFTKEKLIALSASTFFILGSSLFARQVLARLLYWGTPKINFLTLARPVNPAMTWVFFFGFLISFWLFLEKKQWRWGILSILTLGLSFYDFLYTWTFIYVFCGMLLLVFLFQKKWPEAKRVLIVLGGAIVVAIPYFLNLYAVTLHPNYLEVAQRFGMLEGRQPMIGFLAPLLIVAVLVLFPRFPKERYWFALALAVAPFVVLNQQLITAKTLSHVHYHWYFTKPLAMIFFLIIIFFFLLKTKWHFLAKPFAILVIAVSIATGIFVQNASYASNKEDIVAKQKYGPVMDWLNENGKKEDVVFANTEEASRLLVVYTPMNLLYHPGGGLTLAASRDRLLDIFFLTYRLDGVEENEADKVFLENRRKISHLLYGMYYPFTAGDYEAIPDAILLDFAGKYKNYLDIPEADFINILLKRYEVRYILWDKNENASWQLDKYSFLKKATQSGDFIIYEYAGK